MSDKVYLCWGSEGGDEVLRSIKSSEHAARDWVKEGDNPCYRCGGTGTQPERFYKGGTYYKLIPAGPCRACDAKGVVNDRYYEERPVE